MIRVRCMGAFITIQIHQVAVSLREESSIGVAGNTVATRDRKLMGQPVQMPHAPFPGRARDGILSAAHHTHPKVCSHQLFRCTMLKGNSRRWNNTIVYAACQYASSGDALMNCMSVFSAMRMCESLSISFMLSYNASGIHQFTWNGR